MLESAIVILGVLSILKVTGLLICSWMMVFALGCLIIPVSLFVLSFIIALLAESV